MTFKQNIKRKSMELWAWICVLFAWAVILTARILLVPIFLFVSVLVAIFNVRYGIKETAIALETLAQGLKNIGNDK